MMMTIIIFVVVLILSESPLDPHKRVGLVAIYMWCVMEGYVWSLCNSLELFVKKRELVWVSSSSQYDLSNSNPCKNPFLPSLLFITSIIATRMIILLNHFHDAGDDYYDDNDHLLIIMIVIIVVVLLMSSPPPIIITIKGTRHNTTVWFVLTTPTCVQNTTP